MVPMIFGIIGAALSTISTLSSSISSMNQQRQQAAQLKAQSQSLQRQAEVERVKGDIEAERIEKQKRQLRAEFEDKQARNRVNLASGFVDMTSGSALDVSLGNINAFASDIGENAYEKALKLWEANENSKNLEYQAEVARRNSSYLNQTAGNLGMSLLTTALSGAMGFAGGYTLAGGQLGSLWGSKPATTATTATAAKV